MSCNARQTYGGEEADGARAGTETENCGEEHSCRGAWFIRHALRFCALDIFVQKRPILFLIFLYRRTSTDCHIEIRRPQSPKIPRTIQ